MLGFYNIYRQYTIGKNIRGHLNKFKFVDTKIIRLAELNIDCLSSRVYFDRNFPEELYTRDVLHLLAQKNGVGTTRGDIYSRLYFLSLIEIFYQGKCPNAVEDVTFINREEINDVPNEKVLSYGTLGEKVYYITLSELAMAFQNSKDFRNPFTPGEILSNRAVKSINRICRKIQEFPDTYSSEVVDESRDLLRSMDFVAVISTEKISGSE